MFSWLTSRTTWCNLILKKHLLHKPADILYFLISQVVGILPLWLLSVKIWETQTGISPPIVLAELIHISLEQF